MNGRAEVPQHRQTSDGLKRKKGEKIMNWFKRGEGLGVIVSPKAAFQKETLFCHFDVNQPAEITQCVWNVWRSCTVPFSKQNQQCAVARTLLLYVQRISRSYLNAMQGKKINPTLFCPCISNAACIWYINTIDLIPNGFNFLIQSYLCKYLDAFLMHLLL